MTMFHFRFEQILRLRESERQQRRFELAQAFEADQILQRQVAEADLELASVRQTVRQAAAPGDVNVDRLLELQRHGLHIQAHVDGLRSRQKQLRDEIERRRQVLVEADRQVRMFEKLRDKQEHAFLIEQQKREQMQWDEIAGRRHEESTVD